MVQSSDQSRAPGSSNAGQPAASRERADERVKSHPSVGISTRHREGTPAYLVACDRSFGQYLFDALLDAGDEFGIGVAPGS